MTAEEKAREALKKELGFEIVRMHRNKTLEDSISCCWRVGNEVECYDPRIWDKRGYDLNCSVRRRNGN
jgi:hypothetical protein